jgi:DNA (cytosine-5)-methyltransferase 1
VKPLAEATLRRIARGVMRYVVNNPKPFIVHLDHQSSKSSGQSIDEPLTTITSKARHLLVAPAIVNTRNGEREGQAPRVRSIQDPYPTVTAIGSQGGLVAAFLAKHYGGHENDGAPMDAPMHTITAVDHHAQVCAFLLKYYGTDQDPRLGDPLHTITSKDRFGLVTVHGEKYTIADIGMRMLVPAELFRAQGFPADVKLLGTKTSQVRLCGNSVSPPTAAAIVRANYCQQAEAVAA